MTPSAHWIVKMQTLKVLHRPIERNKLSAIATSSVRKFSEKNPRDSEHILFIPVLSTLAVLGSSAKY